jgi:hypothetical protein
MQIGLVSRLSINIDAARKNYLKHTCQHPVTPDRVITAANDAGDPLTVAPGKYHATDHQPMLKTRNTAKAVPAIVMVPMVLIQK